MNNQAGWRIHRPDVWWPGASRAMIVSRPNGEAAVIVALGDLSAEYIPYSIDTDGLNVQVRDKSTHTQPTALAGVPIGSSAWQPVPR